MQLDAAVQGLGMAYVPANMGDTYAELQRIPGLPVAPSRSIWILLHSDLQRTARVRAVVDFIADWIVPRKGMFEK